MIIKGWLLIHLTWPCHIHLQFQIFLGYNQSQGSQAQFRPDRLQYQLDTYVVALQVGTKKNPFGNLAGFQFIITFHSVLMVYMINDHSPHDSLSNYPLIIIQH